MKKTCLLISGGEYADIPEDMKNAEYVIACDRGWQYAKSLGLTPDLIIGDFDSSPVPDTDIPLMKFPSHKDDTDTMIAARHALELGYKDIMICCAFGARLDHTIANIQTAAFLVKSGATVRLTGVDTECYVFTCGSKKIKRIPGFSLSLFSLTDSCVGVSISGTEYEAENITLTNSFPLGVSNAWSSDEALIGVKEGILMVLCSGYGETKLK